MEFRLCRLECAFVSVCYDDVASGLLLCNAVDCVVIDFEFLLSYLDVQLTVTEPRMLFGQAPKVLVQTGFASSGPIAKGSSADTKGSQVATPTFDGFR